MRDLLEYLGIVVFATIVILLAQQLINAWT